MRMLPTAGTRASAEQGGGHGTNAGHADRSRRGRLRRLDHRRAMGDAGGSVAARRGPRPCCSPGNEPASRPAGAAAAGHRPGARVTGVAAMADLRDFLARFRPAGTPGAARAGVPADRPAELEAEVGPVLALLAGTDAECGRL